MSPQGTTAPRQEAREENGPLVLAIDQGTTGTTALVISLEGLVLARKNVEFAQHFPQPGWVEHDLEDIWRSVEEAVTAALGGVPRARDRLAAIGITNQRETMALWEAESGRPLGRALVWQDRRTSPRTEELMRAGHGPRVTELTGLVIDPYFSATKLEWLLRSDAALARRAETGEVHFGTIDSFLLRRLSGSARVHAIEVTNASRTLLMDLDRREFSDELLQLFGVPKALLPRIVPSTGVVAKTSGLSFLPDGIALSGVLGDQHAALLGQGCTAPGDAKCTYGTGAFVLMNTGQARVPAPPGLLTTLAWEIDGVVNYAIEGSSFVAGAVVQWLRDGLGIIESAADIEALARSVPSSAGVVFVPALAGLGAPYWDPEATGLVTGITRGTTRAHLARAALEGIVWSVEDLLDVMNRGLTDRGGPRLRRLRVDGGAAGNDLLLELQASASRLDVERPPELESTGRGAGLAAAVGAGLVDFDSAVKAFALTARTFSPRANAEALSERDRARAGWDLAVRRARLR